MIEVRYTDRDEIDISGSVPELQELRRAVLEVATSGTRLEIEADQSVDPQPYDRTLSKIVIGLEANPTDVSVANGAVRIDGAPDCLQTLASFLDFQSDTETGHHSHYEYYDGNKWIAPTSVPVVFRVR